MSFNKQTITYGSVRGLGVRFPFTDSTDYILALKGNQQHIREETESIFRVQKPDYTNEITEKVHGRIETRKFEIINDLEFFFGQ